MSDLQLPCAVHHERKRGISIYDRFTADIFGISPVDEQGHVRELGNFWSDNCRAVFWIVEVVCLHQCALSSNYEVTLLDIDDTYFNGLPTYTYVIHPVPIDELHNRIRFAYPRVTLIVNNSEHELSPVKGNCTWSDDNYCVHMLAWLPSR